MILKYITNSSSQTKKIGEFFAKKIIKTNPLRSAILIGLKGDLGGGKTTFLQGFAKGLGVKEKITSPTFVIMKKYRIENSKLKIANFFHLDCYRIQKPREILNIGFRKIISNKKNIIAVEWAERIKKLISPKNVWITFKLVNKKKREIKIKI